MGGIGRLFQEAFLLYVFFVLLGEGFEDVHVNAGFVTVAAVFSQDGGEGNQERKCNYGTILEQIREFFRVKGLGDLRLSYW